MILKPLLKYVYENQTTDHVPLGSGVTLCEKYHIEIASLKNVHNRTKHSIATTMSIILHISLSKITVNQISDYFLNSFIFSKETMNSPVCHPTQLDPRKRKQGMNKHK